MKARLFQSYWIRRLLASDPGRKRLNQAGKATVSVISAVFTSLWLLNMFGNDPLLPSIMSGVGGLLGIMAVMDDTKQQKQVTTMLMPLPAFMGITLGSLLSFSAFYVSALMIAIIFCAFYFSKFGSRYFSLGMIGFITVYFSSFLKLPPDQFVWFYLAVTIGISYAFLYNFIVFKDSAQLLRRSMQSFHRQANLTFQLLIEIIQEPESKTSRKNKLEYNISKLRKYAIQVSTDLNTQDIKDIWPGLESSQLRLYVFDTAMFVMTLSDSLQKLKESEALEITELRNLLVRVILTLQQAEVLDSRNQEEHLSEAEKVVGALRAFIDDLFKERTTRPEGWLYLLRRIEAIATHVTEGAIEVRYKISHHPDFYKQNESEKDEEEEEEKEGLEPTTKKAIQSILAGTIAVIVGHLLSPIQPYWVLLTTFIVQLGTETVGRTYLKGLERSIGTVIGALIGFVLAKSVSGYSELEVVLIFLVIFSAFYFLSVSYTLTSMFITMLIAFMYDLMLGGISYHLLGARVVDTIAGALIALGVAAFIYPTKTMEKVNEVLLDYLEDLETYVLKYMKSFQGIASVKHLADLAFEMDEKVQSLEDESKPVVQGPVGMKYSDLPRLLTMFIAINYYAKQLVASSYQKNFHYSKEVHEAFQMMEEKFCHNIRVLCSVIENKGGEGTLYDLHAERETIERYAPGHNDGQGDLVHHLFYVWKINQTLMMIGARIGVERKEERE
ncbi:Fusaric acid resistance protein-like [Halobacillus dabanensis]|uniref:Fusaric acid resistance protein-like n=1 Tax=Halobacillus dabanensis TaxID=240302 RepID=A0A1I3VFX5_HALDA|nr:FUSC family protein [Halobacillus dabanensis]SFJ94070.1 Fusaric acid resistance protein-like [Halobacillus dabanensis]